MIYGAILAGGKGTRMGYTDMPKQYLYIGNKPIIIHTIEKFLINARFDKIYIGVPEEWMPHTKDIVNKYIGVSERIEFVVGGSDRNGTILNIISSVKKVKGINDDDVIVTHDAVRPFLTHRILNDNIDSAIEFGACDTVIPAADTIVISNDKEFLSEIPERDKIFIGQTPQSFNINLLLENYSVLNESQKSILTDACKIFVLNGVNVKNVAGESFNIKITTPFDLKMANAILEMGESE